MTKEEAQKTYLMLQEIEERAKIMQQQMLILNQQIMEIAATLQSIEELELAEAGSRSYSTVGQGIYVGSQITDTKTLLVNVGAGVIIRKTLQETKDMLAQQFNETQGLQQKAENELRRIAQEGNRLKTELQGLISLAKDKAKA